MNLVPSTYNGASLQTANIYCKLAAQNLTTGASANYVAAWDGSTWAPLGTGLNAHSFALALYENKLIAGGEFSSAGGVNVSNIAAWNGSAWSALGTGTNNAVGTLTSFGNSLIAGGFFTTAGGDSVNYIAVWGPK